MKSHRIVELIMRNRVDMFTIAFQPAGVATLFSIPASELTNEDPDATLLDRGVAGLHARMAEAGSFDARARLVDDYLCAKLSTHRSPGCISRLASGVIARNGCVAVSSMVAASGLGARQFERRFRHEVGLPPKLFARIVRFESALRLKTAAPDVAWTQIAHSLGYHDQMHMVHDFRQLAGDTPTSLLGQMAMFVTPEVALGGPPPAGGPGYFNPEMILRASSGV
jgi:AraC-like DNA-binding protein